MTSKPAKLTLNQIAAMLEVQDGNVYQTSGRSPRINGASPTVIGRLHSMGFIEWQDHDSLYIATLTPAGEQAIKDNTQQD